MRIDKWIRFSCSLTEMQFVLAADDHGWMAARTN